MEAFHNPLTRQKYLEFDQEVITAMKTQMGFLETELENILHIGSSHNDGLNGEGPVVFKTKNEQLYQIIHSQAKLKRQYMSTYQQYFETFDKDDAVFDTVKCTELDEFTTRVEFTGPAVMPKKAQGMVSKMYAIRAQELPDETHSYSVRQYEFCVKVKPDQTSEDKLATLKTYLKIMVPNLLELAMPEEKSFLIVHSDRFFKEHQGDLTSAEIFEQKRTEFETKLGQESKCFIVVAIGKKDPTSGLPYDTRASDYDDWQANCDIFMHNGKRTIEVCSMGFRVDGNVLQAQMEEHGKPIEGDYHLSIMNKDYVQTLGGGIGLDRLRMCKFQLDHIEKSNPNV
jgi:asparagine synthetase A